MFRVASERVFLYSIQTSLMSRLGLGLGGGRMAAAAAAVGSAFGSALASFSVGICFFTWVLVMASPALRSRCRKSQLSRTQDDDIENATDAKTRDLERRTHTYRVPP